MFTKVKWRKVYSIQSSQTTNLTYEVTPGVIPHLAYGISEPNSLSMPFAMLVVAYEIREFAFNSPLVLVISDHIEKSVYLLYSIFCQPSNILQLSIKFDYSSYARKIGQELSIG